MWAKCGLNILNRGLTLKDNFYGNCEIFNSNEKR